MAFIRSFATRSNFKNRRVNYANTGNPVILPTFRYRTIYTRGYVSAGYKSSSPWRSVNRTEHATDITTLLGDLLDTAASYIDGSWSDFYHYCYGMSGGVQGTSTRTCSINMATEASRTTQSAWFTTVSRTNSAAMMNNILTVAYITCGASAVTDKHNLVTESMVTAIGNNPVGGGGTAGGASRFFGDTRGWINYNGSAAYLTWSNETWTSGGLTFAANSDGQPKGLSSKYGYGYQASGTYSGSATYYKFNDLTGGSSVASVTRPLAGGEENQQVGQDWGYTLGFYDGTNQVNNTYKLVYGTDTVTTLGSLAQPKGADGRSSGACGTAGSLIPLIV